MPLFACGSLSSEHTARGPSAPGSHAMAQGPDAGGACPVAACVLAAGAVQYKWPDARVVHAAPCPSHPRLWTHHLGRRPWAGTRVVRGPGRPGWCRQWHSPADMLVNNSRPGGPIGCVPRTTGRRRHAPGGGQGWPGAAGSAARGVQGRPTHGHDAQREQPGRRRGASLPSQHQPQHAVHHGRRVVLDTGAFP